MAALADIRRRVRRKIYGIDAFEKPTHIFAVSTVALGSTTVTVLTGRVPNPPPNIIIENEDSGEQVLVTNVATASPNDTLTIVRAWDGTTAAEITLTDPLTIEPRWTAAEIDEAITSVIAELDPALQFVTTKTLTAASITGDDEIYDLDATTTNVLQVYQVESNIKKPLPFGYWGDDYDTPAAISTSGGILILRDTHNYDLDLYVRYERPWVLADLTPQMEEMVAWGAAARLLPTADLAGTHEPGRRTNRGQQAGTVSRLSTLWQQQFAALLRVERRKLLRIRQRYMEPEYCPAAPLR